MPNYGSLINTCLSLAFRTPSPVRQLREHNTNVYRTMGDIRRYQKYITRLIQNRQISAEERQQQLSKLQTAIQTANDNYKTTSDKYLELINQLAAKLDTTPVMQECVEIIQSATLSQMTQANDLMTLPIEICNLLNSVYATLEKVTDAAYIKIGARLL